MPQPKGTPALQGREDVRCRPLELLAPRAMSYSCASVQAGDGRKSLKPRPSDVEIAKIMAWLIANGMEVHIPIRGPIRFCRKGEDR